MTQQDLPRSSDRVGIDYVPDQPLIGGDQAVTSLRSPDPIAGSVSTDSLGGWQDFELMPPHYRAQRHAEQTLCIWTTVLIILLSVTVGSSIALWLRGRQRVRRHAKIVSMAKPIGDLRRKAQVLETENVLLEQWCRWVESAKPDDSLVQVLGAVTLATHPDEKATRENQLDVQSIEVKLPREYDSSSPKPPAWAAAKFSLSAIANGRDLLMPWNERLEKSGRLTNLKLTTPGGAWREALVQVSASPLSTRIVP